MKQRTLGEKLLLGVFIVATPHFIDHILRVDHSGWPFKPEVSPLTFIIPAVYILIAITWFARSRPKLRVVTAGLVLSAAVLSHALIETPWQLYGMWAHNYSAPSMLYPGDPHVSNALGIKSPLLGAIGVAIVLLLVVLTIVAELAFIREARQGHPKYKDATR